MRQVKSDIVCRKEFLEWRWVIAKTSFLVIFYYLISVGFALTQELNKSSRATNFNSSGWLYGMIVDVDSDGNLILDSGMSVDLWGISSSKISAIRSIVDDHSVFCRVLVKSSKSVVGDCSLVPKGKMSIDSEGLLDIYYWLPDLGLANHMCSASDTVKGFIGITHELEFYYVCDADGIPRKIKSTE